jgi:hypothetical protein
MEQVSESVLVEALTDIQVEIQAIHLALVQVNIPTDTVQALKSEVDRDEVRRKMLEKLSGQQSVPGASR